MSDKTVKVIKEAVGEGQIDPGVALREEKRGKGRVTLIRWLESRLESESVEDELEKRKRIKKEVEEEREAKLRTYNFPLMGVSVKARDIDEAKEKVKSLEKEGGE